MVSNFLLYMLIVIVILLNINISISYCNHYSRFLLKINNDNLINKNAITISRNIDKHIYLSDTDKDNNIEDDIISIEDEISIIVDHYIETYSKESNNPLNPMLLSDNSHIISKGRIYEDIMDNKLSNCNDPKEIKVLEYVNTFIQSYINYERKSRSRLKVNYILAGASTNRLEESIKLLSDSDEIDEHLLSYIDSLIQKELLRAGGPTVNINDEMTIEGIGKVTINALRLIERRLQAEIKTKDRDDLKLLANLLQVDDPKIRESIILDNFKYIEDINEFERFIDDGINYLVNNQQSNSSSDDSNIPLNSNIYEKLKDITISLQLIKKLLETGYNTKNTIYSTSSEDYLSTTLSDDP